MIWKPNVGDRVQAWYGKDYRAMMPHHGMCGEVIACKKVKGRSPCNALIKFDDGSRAVVPRGNIRTEVIDGGQTLFG